MLSSEAGYETYAFLRKPTGDYANKTFALSSLLLSQAVGWRVLPGREATARSFLC
jgi:hypothetical protein